MFYCVLNNNTFKFFNRAHVKKVYQTMYLQRCNIMSDKSCELLKEFVI